MSEWGRFLLCVGFGRRPICRTLVDMDLSPVQIDAIREWATSRPEIAEVRLYGSRATGPAGPCADVDLTRAELEAAINAELAKYDVCQGITVAIEKITDQRLTTIGTFTALEPRGQRYCRNAWRSYVKWFNCCRRSTISRQKASAASFKSRNAPSRNCRNPASEGSLPNNASCCGQIQGISCPGWRRPHRCFDSIRDGRRSSCRGREENRGVCQTRLQRRTRSLVVSRRRYPIFFHRGECSAARSWGLLNQLGHRSQPPSARAGLILIPSRVTWRSLRGIP